MKTVPISRTSRLREVLGAAAVAVGVSVTLAADAKADVSHAAPLAARMHEASDSLRSLQNTDPESGKRPDARGERKDEGGNSIGWGNYWANFNPWRNWNNWNNWHNFNQWVNL